MLYNYIRSIFDDFTLWSMHNFIILSQCFGCKYSQISKESLCFGVKSSPYSLEQNQAFVYDTRYNTHSRLMVSTSMHTFSHIN